MNRTGILTVDDEPGVEEHEAGHGRVVGIDTEAMGALEVYRWPGNARELRRLRAPRAGRPRQRLPSSRARS